VQQWNADRVRLPILSSDLPAIDIDFEKSKVRERSLERYLDQGNSMRAASSGFGNSFGGRGDCGNRLLIPAVRFYCRTLWLKGGDSVDPPRVATTLERRVEPNLDDLFGVVFVQQLSRKA